MIEFTLPLRLNSSLNKREHWRVTNQRKQLQRGMAQAEVTMARVVYRVEAPFVVTLTRIGKRNLDAHDNLRDACKFVVDGIAKALGVDDGDTSAVRWEYAQERGRKQNKETLHDMGFSRPSRHLSRGSAAEASAEVVC